jgi:hypothetical protein
VLDAVLPAGETATVASAQSDEIMVLICILRGVLQPERMTTTMTAKDFAEEMRILVAEAEDEGVERSALIAALEAQIAAMRAAEQE